jgi:hypothetical protein
MLSEKSSLMVRCQVVIDKNQNRVVDGLEDGCGSSFVIMHLDVDRPVTRFYLFP